MPRRVMWMKMRKHGGLWAAVAVVAVAGVGCLVAALVLGTLRPAVVVRKAEPKKVEVVPAVPLEMPAVHPPVSGPTETLEQGVVTAPVAEVSAMEVVRGPEVPLWVKHAVAVEVPAGVPMLAIVLDDVGVAVEDSARAVRNLPAGVTFSFLPYGEGTPVQARQARELGHEVMVHIPMEPLPHADEVLDMGPHGLTVGMAADEIEARVLMNVGPLMDLAVGANNHMGSKFTGWEEGMRVVLTVLQREGLFFLDSKTIADTSVRRAAQGLELPVASRDVFLDHVPEAAAVRRELDKAVAMARKRAASGRAVVVIGHPLPVTLDVLETELPRLVSEGVVLVPVTAVREIDEKAKGYRRVENVGQL